MTLRLAALGNLLVILFALLQPAYAAESIEDRHKRQATEAGDAIDKANQALKDKNYDLAITLLTKAIDSKGLESANVGNAYYTRGVAHSLKDECALAIPDFDQAIEHVHDKAEMFYSRALCEGKMNLVDKQLADLDAAIKIDTNSPQFRYGRCVVLFNKHDFAGALPDCELALAGADNINVTDKNDLKKTLLTAAGQSAEQTGAKAKASSLYHQLLQLDPSNANAIAGLKRVGG